MNCAVRSYLFADGYTITVLDADKKQHKVRLNGIDAPEKAQAFGAKSKAHLGELVAGKATETVGRIGQDCTIWRGSCRMTRIWSKWFASGAIDLYPQMRRLCYLGQNK
jgi:endonuclease YncB( thermonuclease family)